MKFVDHANRYVGEPVEVGDSKTTYFYHVKTKSKDVQDAMEDLANDPDVCYLKNTNKHSMDEVEFANCKVFVFDL